MPLAVAYSHWCRRVKRVFQTAATQLTHSSLSGVKKQTKRSQDKIGRSSEIMAQLLASSIITWMWIGTFCFTAIAPLIAAGEFIAFSLVSLSLSILSPSSHTIKNRRHGGFFNWAELNFSRRSRATEERQKLSLYKTVTF